MNSPSYGARSRHMPILPSTYGLPWERGEAMFPLTARGHRSHTSHSTRAETAVDPALKALWAADPSLKPRVLTSSFGLQANSLRESPASVVLGGGPERFHTFTKWSYRGPPGPQFPAYSTFGPQPLSTFFTASRPITSKDTRWGAIERFQRATATPGPGTYNPCI